MKNVYLISTDKPSRLHLWTDENGTRPALCELEYSHTRNTQNIYITNDEEIKVGDWVFDSLENDVIKRSNFLDINGYIEKFCKKIILTTDQDLIAYGVQSIDKTFLEWFVKNPSCESVEVNLNSFGECHMKGDGCSCYDTTDQSLCELHYPNYKIIIPKEEPKQETLYEAAEKYAEHQLTGIDDKFSKFECINDFIAGAEFQQQQDKNKFSEEDMKLAFETGRNFQLTGENNFNELIEQFKKK